ncbi:putative membrane protein [Filimonas lacunae]|uniref:Putative membrane protein n=1 Tax=Filimonas lacunae TaxID=477680 RepID=A0A173MKX1_9BACT|nr:bestrophin family ion channel [Filimonas lacunae]BAV08254.1 membrane protein STY1534 [Filimonas lacunae]SIT33177.1 putative membrane protein [Filimonas lacunae]
MISYNPKNWLTFIFRFHKADTVRLLAPLMLVIAVYTFLVSYLELHYMHLAEKGIVENIPLMHNLLGFAISMLLVFRTNTAYDRWWEGRRSWGALVNSSRNLAIKINAFLPAEDTQSRAFFAKLISRFAFELQRHLQKESTRLQLDVQPHPEIPDFDTSKHVPVQVMSLMTSRINQLYKQNKITGDQLIVLNNEIQSFMDICGACERIKNTPIPFSYSSFIKKFIFFYIMTLPFGFAFKLGYLNIPVVVFVFYVMASLELIAEEIEDPFGSDANDLPLQRISENIQRNVNDIFSTE